MITMPKETVLCRICVCIEEKKWWIKLGGDRKEWKYIKNECESE